MKHVFSIKRYIMLMLIAMSLSWAIALPVGAVGLSKDQVCQGIGAVQGASSDCQDQGNSGKKSVEQTIKSIVDVLSFVVGAASVIMIIVGGLRYVLSNGDSGSITSAKNTIIYSLVGLVIVATAQIIVNFVINQTL